MCICRHAFYMRHLYKRTITRQTACDKTTDSYYVQMCSSPSCTRACTAPVSPRGIFYPATSMMAALSSPRRWYRQGNLGISCVPHPHCINPVAVLIRWACDVPIFRPTRFVLAPTNTFRLILVLALYTHGTPSFVWWGRCRVRARLHISSHLAITLECMYGWRIALFSVFPLTYPFVLRSGHHASNPISATGSATWLPHRSPSGWHSAGFDVIFCIFNGVGAKTCRETNEWSTNRGRMLRICR